MSSSISASDFKTLVQSGVPVDLIDVRTPAEFRSVHITIARNEPLDQLNPQAIQAARNGNSQQPLYIVCRSGMRGQQACEKFVASGISNVVNVEGGTLACQSAGVPVLIGKKSIPLNCQVQIVAGSLIVIGSALTLVSPYWGLLPAVMGLGLMHSGITNTCMMGSILGRMPWNRA